MIELINLIITKSSKNRKSVGTILPGDKAIIGTLYKSF